MQLELYNGMQWLPMMTGGASSFWWADADGDTYGDPFNVIYAPMAPPFFVANSDDCDDSNANIKPGAPEICDGIDNDCDGLVDDDDPGIQGLLTFFQDLDGDGFGTNAQTIQACEVPPGYSANAADCDDENAAIYPGAPEYCNSIDDNCDGAVDEGQPEDAIATWIDADADGFGDAGSDTVWQCMVLPGFAENNQDCDDADPNIYPGANEICDMIDNNCNGVIDEPTGLTCSIGGECYSAGEINPMNACEFCDPALNPMGWSPFIVCASGEICCDGNCINPNTDPLNCGDCGIVCEDGLPCTIDFCTNGVCSSMIDPNTCFIAGVCYNNGDPNPVAECQVCDPAVSQTGWTNAAAGTPCSGGECDGNGNCN